MRGARRFGPWGAFVDLLLCCLVVIITMIATKHVETDNPKQNAQYLITLEWSVDVDVDVDLWVIPPPGDKPLYYDSREVGCMHLDRDSRGFMDNIVTLPDGRTVKSLSAKETATMRCIVPGRYDIGAHLYSYRPAPETLDKSLGLKVRLEVVKINPAIETVFAQDVTLDRVWQTVNAASFDLDAEGRATFVDPPLAPVTLKFYHGRTQ